MKKFFVGVLAIAGLVACAQDEVLRTQDFSEQIAFSGYTNTAVRTAVDPSATSTTLDEFTVWGYMDSAAGTLLTAERVYGNGVWTYDNLQYWTKNHNYRFLALASNKGNLAKASAAEPTINDTEVTALGDLALKVTFTNNDGSEDLLYACADASTQPNNGVYATPNKVGLAFDHLLSKVKFTFKNGFSNNNNKVVVKNLKMTAPQGGSITLNAQDAYTWTATDADTTLAFGGVESGAKIERGASGECDNERLTVPAGTDREYTVTFDVELWNGDVKAYDSAEAGETCKTVITGLTLEPGKAYNFTATLTASNVADETLEPIEFTATVDTWITAGDYPIAPGVNSVYVNSRDELQAALNEVSGITRNGVTPMICLGCDIEGNVIIDQVEGKSYIIDGCGHKYDGTMEIYGHAGNNKAETLTIKNVNFEHAGSNIDFISCNTTESEKRYAHNVTVEGCTFTGDNANGNDVVGMRFRQCYNIVVKGCTATGMHSLLWATGGENCTIEGVTVENSKNGISFGTTTNIAVSKSNVSVTGYGVRADGSVATTLTLADNTITAAQGIVVRKVTTNGYKVTLGENVAITTNEDYQVVFTKDSDDAAYVAPTVAYTYSSVDNFNVFPVAPERTANVNTVDDLLKWLNAGSGVLLNEDLTLDKATTTNGYGATGVAVTEGQTIDGGGHTLSISAGGTWDSGISTTGGLIKNIWVTKSFRGIFIKKGTQKVVLENVRIEGTVYTISCDEASKQGLEAYNSIFRGWTSYAGTIGTAYFEGCTFGAGNGYNFMRPYAPTVYKNCTFEAGHEIDPRAAVSFEGCTFDGVALTSANLSQLVTSNIANATVIE